VAASLTKSRVLGLLAALNRAFWYLEGAGGWRLGHPTDLIVKHLLKNLPWNDAERLSRQLLTQFFQERPVSQRITRVLFSLEDTSVTLELPKYQDCLFKVEMMVQGKNERANVIFSNGYLYLIELSKPLKFFKGKVIEFGAVTQGKAKETITRALDRLEHRQDETEV
jgi:hypothetical protein